MLWSSQLFPNTGPSVVDINVDNNGSLLLTGTFSGTYDFDPGAAFFNMTGPDAQDMFVWKLDNSGNFTWAKRVIGGYSNASASLTTDGYGNVYTTGFYSGTGNHDFDPGPGTFSFGGSGMFIQKLNASGNFVWALSMAGANNAMAFGKAIQVNGSGDIFTGNTFNGSVDFDPAKPKYLLDAANGPFVVHRITQSGGGAFADWTLPILTEKSTVNMTVYPNPNSGNFYMDVPSMGGDAAFTIYDNMGHIIRKGTFNGNVDQRLLITDIGSKGVYEVQISSKLRTFVTKVSVQ
jgi:hypothetical protein